MKDIIKYNVREYEGVKILDISGNLNSNTVENFRSVIQAMADRESFMINLEDVKLVSAAGYNALVELSYYSKDKERRLVILWAGSDFLKVVEQLDIYHHLTFAESYDQGVTKIKLFT